MANPFDQFDIEDRARTVFDQFNNGKLTDNQLVSFNELKGRGIFDQFDQPILETPEDEPDYIQPMTLKNVVSSAIKNTPRSAKEFVSDIITPFLHPKDTAKALSGLAKGVGEKFIPGRQDNEQIVDDIIEMFKDRYGGIENIKKTLAEDPVGLVADISTLLVPGGAVVKGIGAVSKVKTISKIGKVAAKVGEVLEPVTAVGKIIKKTVSKIIPKQMPSNLYQSAAKLSTVIPEKTRKILSTTALDNRIMPTLKGLDDLREKINVINDEITTIIDGATTAGKKIPTEALFTKFKELRKNALLSSEPITQKRTINRIAKQIHTANKKAKKGLLTPEEVQKLKQNIYKETESLYSKTSQKPIKGVVKQAIAKSAKESLEKLFPEIKKLNKREGSLLALRKELEKSASRISNRDLLGIGIPIKGGAGGAVAGMPGLVGGAALGLFDTPAVKAKLAIVLNSLKKKGVILAGDSLLKQMLEIAPGGGAIAARQAGKLTEE